MNNPRRAVYTALLGGYEARLSEPPESDIDFVCLTDDPQLTSDRWRIEVVEPVFTADPVRSARHLKILGHPVLSGYDETLWIDNRVDLLVDPHEMLDRWLESTDLSMPWHSYRESVLDEFVAVLDGGFDDPYRIQEQLLHYLVHEPETLQQKPYWTAIIARRVTPEVMAAMHLWHDQVLRYSRRDQLSVNSALNRSGISVTAQPVDNTGSSQHAWRTFEDAGRRSYAEMRRADLAAFLPPVATLRAAEQQAEEAAEQAQTYREATVGLAHELDRTESERQELERLLAQSEGARGELEREVARLQSAIDELHASQTAEATEATARQEEVQHLSQIAADLVAQRTEMLSSTSWVVTRPLRALSAKLSARRGR